MDSIAKVASFRYAGEQDLIALEWNGEYQHFRRLYLDVFQSSLRREAIMWVVELPGKGIIGQAFVQLNSARLELADGFQRCYLYGFRIMSHYRNQGIGTRFMQTIELDVLERGFHHVTLNVSKDNRDARRLYERLGYHYIADEPGHWSYLDQYGHRHDVVEPAWRMEKLLCY